MPGNKSLVAILLAAASHWALPVAGQDYRFDSSISRTVLENYLDRSISFTELLHDDLNKPRNARGVDPRDNLRLILLSKAKFVGRALMVWGREKELSAFLATAKPFAAALHYADPEIVLQAAAFEIVTQGVETISIPEHVLREFDQPLEDRTFRYQDMLYANGRFVSHWGGRGSVPDMSRLETRMWFYFLVSSYIDVGIEAIHFGQVGLMDKNDPGHAGWLDMLGRVRAYARQRGRRHFLVCDAHAPAGGFVEDGRLLFDFHSFPLRIVEVADQPHRGVLKVGYADSIFNKSMGGLTPSGWSCEHLPYVVEFDNFGRSTPGKPSKSPFIWGWDEVTWFALMPEKERNDWLRYAWKWVKETDPNGHLQMPGSRVITPGTPDGPRWYWANTRSEACPNGSNTEETIKELWGAPREVKATPGGVRVGAASVEFKADDSMIIAGGILEGRAKGSEGKLRAVAVVLEKAPFGKFAIVANDVLMMTREELDPVVAEIEKTLAIPAAHTLINCTHTHHAPSTLRLHGYGPVPPFVLEVQRAMIKAVADANQALSADECRFFFNLGREETVGQNSRQLLDDGQVYWIGPRTGFVRPTGPFDPELPVLAFRDGADQWRAAFFNHSTHTIGTRQPGTRSPGFYGLAAQELEAKYGGTFCFLEGASGSTHNLTLGATEATTRIGAAVAEALEKAQPRAITRLAAIKRPFKFRVRHFDEAAEAAAVDRYCRKYAPDGAAAIAGVFASMRADLAAVQGQERETWLQVMQIGDVAIAGVPAEYFTQLGLDLKNRSPFRNLLVAELANDWIGYLPNLEAHKLGGYQVWTGFHSYAEPGTGERIADEITAMLRELAGTKP